MLSRAKTVLLVFFRIRSLVIRLIWKLIFFQETYLIGYFLSIPLFFAVFFHSPPHKLWNKLYQLEYSFDWNDVSHTYFINSIHCCMYDSTTWFAFNTKMIKKKEHTKNKNNNSIYIMDRLFRRANEPEITKICIKFAQNKRMKTANTT